MRMIAVWVVNLLARFADKTVCAWPNETDEG